MHPGVYSLTLGCISFYSYSRLSFNRQSRRIGAAAAIALLLRSREEKRHRAGAYVRTGYKLKANVKHITSKALLFKQGNKRFRVLGRVGMGNAYIRFFIGGKRTVFFGKGCKRRFFAACLSAGYNMPRFIAL